MPISISCECGKKLALRDDLSGKRVRCPACNGVVTVPAAGANGHSEAPPAPTGPIRFSCDQCSKAIAVKPEFAGRKVKCPGCASILSVPASGAASEPSPVQADRPRSRPGSRTDEDEEKPRRARGEDEDNSPEENEDDKPRKAKKRGRERGKSRVLLWVGIAAGILLLVGAGVGMFLWLRGGASADFDMVPRDAMAFGTFRVADTLKTDVGKKLLESARKENGADLKQLEDKLGMGLEDIERVTAVVVSPKSTYFIVKTSKAYDQKKILTAAEDPTEQTHEGKKYYKAKDPGKDLGIWFTDDKTLVMGTTEALKTCIEGKTTKKGPLEESIVVASKKKYHIVYGVNASAAMGLMQMQGGGLGGFGQGQGGVRIGAAAAMQNVGGGRPGGAGGQQGAGGGRPGGAGGAFGAGGGRPGGAGGGRPGGAGGGAGGAGGAGGGFGGAMGGAPGGGLFNPSTLGLEAGYLAVVLGDQIEIEAGAAFNSKDKAKDAETVIKQGIDALKGLILLAGLNDNVAGVDGKAATDLLKKTLDKLTTKQDGKNVIISVQIDTTEVTKLIGQLNVADVVGGGLGGGGGGGGGGEVGGPGKADELKAQNNLKQITLALINHATTTNKLENSINAVGGVGRRPLLSWRVAILPYLGPKEKELYDKIKKDEPWNSQHNKQFHNQMPKVFELPGSGLKSTSQTYIQVPTGTNTLFPPQQAIRFPAGITDGASNTIMIVEAQMAVNWMQPIDMVYFELLPRNGLGSHYKKGAMIGLADGTVRYLSTKVSDATVKNAFNPTDGQVLGADWNEK